MFPAQIMPCLMTKRNPSLNFRVVIHSCTLMCSILSILFPSPCLLLLPKLTKAVWRWKHTGAISEGNPLSYKPVNPSNGWVDIDDFCRILVSSLKGILQSIAEVLKHAKSPPTSTLSFPTLTNEIRSESIFGLETFLRSKVKTFSQEVA